MAESICRALRDGGVEGEHATALTIKDSVHSPFGLEIFDHVLSQLFSFILDGKSQARGLVLVAFSRSPSFYLELLNSRGNGVASLEKWIRILDCYSDPLGWKCRLIERGEICSRHSEVPVAVTICIDVRDSDDLLCKALELGKGLVGQTKDRFSVAIDSVSELLRHAPLSSVAVLLGSLRSHEQVSSTFWLLHSDLHDNSANAALEYMSTIVASVEGAQSKDGQRMNAESFSLLEQNARKGRLRVRFKRRNGRVRLMSEEFRIEPSGIAFTPVSSEDESVITSLLPKVQFNLQLSEKEQADRSKVVLPFEHQEKDKAKQIYDGRSHMEEKNGTITSAAESLPVSEESGRGEILYFRDSDDERPDSDEDPDDDLDI